MLSINPINDLSYYSDLAREDYYLSGGEPPGIWAGKGAFLLDLNGNIDPNDYKNIYRGYAPDGAKLCTRPGDDHRHGWDMTFSPSKSVSVVFARADVELRKSLQKSQLMAIDTAIEFIENHAGITRRAKDGINHEETLGLVVSLFEHSTSRSQDPQLHTHALFANIAPRFDETWGTIESKYLYYWRKAADQIYQNSLAQQIQELGFALEQTKHSFEIVGVPSELIEFYSKRSTAITAALDEIGESTSASHVGSRIKLITREYKKSVDRPSLFKQWTSEMDAKGFTVEKLVNIRGNEKHIPVPFPINSILENLVEKKSVLKLQDIYVSVARSAQTCNRSVYDIEQCVAQIIEDEDVIFLGRDRANNSLFSTPEMIKIEKELLKQAEQLKNSKSFILSTTQVNDSINKLETSLGFLLSDEQSNAVHSVCQSGFDSVQGAAGSGKSISMEATKIAYENSGYLVRGACIAKAAAVQLEDETGIHCSTLAKLFDEVEREQINFKNTILILDEAGQIGTKDLHRLTKLLINDGGKLILLGEDKQLNAITHGGGLRFLSEKLGTTRIETIRRQREPWARDAVQQLRIGDSLPALKAHEKRNLFALEPFSKRLCF